jgi:hypothetical protein
MGVQGKRLYGAVIQSVQNPYVRLRVGRVQQAGGALTCLHPTEARGLRFYKRIRLPAWHVLCQKGTLPPLPHTVALRVLDKNFPYFFMEVGMAYEMRPGQGSAFKNDKKTEDWHPAYRGRIMLPDGSVHWLDASPKKTKAGETWLAIKIGSQVAGGEPSAHSQAKANGYQPQPSNDEDIPF